LPAHGSGVHGRIEVTMYWLRRTTRRQRCKRRWLIGRARPLLALAVRGECRQVGFIDACAEADRKDDRVALIGQVKVVEVDAAHTAEVDAVGKEDDSAPGERRGRRELDAVPHAGVEGGVAHSDEAIDGGGSRGAVRRELLHDGHAGGEGDYRDLVVGTELRQERFRRGLRLIEGRPGHAAAGVERQDYGDADAGGAGGDQRRDGGHAAGVLARMRRRQAGTDGRMRR
jgi:hypothetical protein